MRRGHLGEELLGSDDLLLPIWTAAGGVARPDRGARSCSRGHLLEHRDCGIARSRVGPPPEEPEPVRSRPCGAPAPPGAPPVSLPLSGTARPLRCPLGRHPGRERGEGEMTAGVGPAISRLAEAGLSPTVCRTAARGAAEAGAPARGGDLGQGTSTGVAAPSGGGHFVTHCGTDALSVQVCARQYR